MSETENELETQKETESPPALTVAGIRFRPCGKIYTFKVEDIDAPLGTRVVVESEMGLSIGYIARPKYTIEKPDESLKKVLRVASEEDFETVKANYPLEAEAKAFCIEKVHEYGLEMKVVTTESTLDKKRLIFYFTADGRIDFRELVRDLAAKFKTRIEMRQIGVRDEVKLLGGIGCCGRQACCSLFLTSFAPITIRMAKQQELSINQSKLSGICGRLMCCLSYEYKNGEEKKAAARAGRDKKGLPPKDELSEEISEASVTELKVGEGPQLPVVKTGEDEGEEKSIAPEAPKETRGDRPRRKRRRFRKKKKPSSDRAAQEQPQEKKTEEAQKPGDGKTQQSEQKDKGKPFSRRRKFWKKKKH